MNRLLLPTLMILLVVSGCGPKVGPASELAIAPSGDLLARGQYLANILNCIQCHSKRDFTRVGAPLVPGTEGGGGDLLDGDHNAPGSIPVPNITPTALGDWTDGEIARAITSGVDNEGKALFPIMPYPVYKNLAKEDVESLVVYLRSLAPISTQETDERSLKFPLGIIVNTIPAEADPLPLPVPNDLEGRGQYLLKVSGCFHCHTIEKRGKYKEGMHYAGGHTFKSRGYILEAPNLTPHRETGIGSWSENMFIERFAAYRTPATYDATVDKNAPISFMPWAAFSHFTDDDLRAVFHVLQNLPPIENVVVRQKKAE